METAIAIRPASAADAPLLAWAMTEAQRGGDAEGEWDWVLPGADRERRQLLARLACTGPEHPCHVSRFLVAERGGAACGTLAGYVPGRHSWAHFEQAWYAVFARHGWSREQAASWLARFEPYLVVRVAIPPDDWRVEWVATRPEHRRSGVFAALIGPLLERAREAGCRTAHVATALENAEAIRAYERAGFQRYAEWRHDDYLALTRSAGDVFLRRALE